MTSRPKKSRYPSDLSPEQWSRLEDILPPPAATGRRRTVDPRAIADAINYRWETGCVWRMLPHDFPPWGTVYSYFTRWQRAGVIRQLRDILMEPRPRRMARNPGSERTTPPETTRLNPAAPDHRVAASPSTSEGFSSPHDRRGDAPSAVKPSAPLPQPDAR